MSTAAPRRPRLLGLGDVAIFTLLTIVPLVLGGRGRLNADTKQYLYLDPGGLLDRARSLWDPAVGGTVTHQTIGYLWPMGPYYWFADAIGLPDWVAQRIWIGGIQLAAALGALLVLRALLPRHPAQLVAAALYGLSPFVLGHVTGQSALLLPFAAFGWLVFCVMRSVTEGGWRWPALFALIVTTCGSLNGSSVFFVLLGAVLWIPYAVWWSRDTDLRGGIFVLGRLMVLTVVTQLWWLVAYAVGGRYGLPILSVTENVQTTSNTTSAAEVLRGLGYWFFYGRDPYQPWLHGIADTYTEAPVGIVVSFLVPIVALALGAIVRWGPRVYFTTLVLVGTIIAVGAFPTPRSPLGGAFEAASRRSDLVLSLRNTQRAAPLVVLGLAGLTAAGLGALQRRHARTGLVVAGVMAVLVAGALPAQWRSGLIAERFHREDVPDAWQEAAQYLDEGSGRVLELPGIDFASYRWGHTLDPVSVGLTDRQVLARELVPMGGTPGVSLLAALDRSLQEGTFEPESLAPVARLLGASDVLVRNDLEYERYRTARPHRVWPWFTDESTDLDEPVTFGPQMPNRAVPGRPMIDETELGTPLDNPVPPQVAVLGVPGGGRNTLSSLSVEGSVVLEGDGEGIVAAAAAGLLDRLDGALLLAADATSSEERFASSTGPSTRYVVTDSNRKRAERWYSLRENGGATEPADMPVVLDDPSDARLEIVPGVGVRSRTVVRWDGARRIWASAYGSPYTLVPEDRPSNAFDGDPTTAWRVDNAGFRDGTHRIGIELDEARQADHVTLIPPQGRPGTRAITHARVVLDGARRFDVRVDEAIARDPAGVVVQLDGQPFTRLEVELLEVAPDRGPAGFAEVQIPGVQVEEVVQLPTSLLDTLGTGVSDAPLAFVLTRHRADPSEVVRADPEPALVRGFTVGGPLTLQLQGTARIRANAPDEVVDAALGLASADEGGWSARSSEHLAGAIQARASAAFDGDLRTAWTTPLVGLRQTLELDTGRDIHLERLELDVVSDEHHSAPTRLLVTVDGTRVLPVEIPPLAVGELGSTQHVSVELPEPLDGRVLQITVDAAEPRELNDWYSNDPVALPVAIAEVEVPALPSRPGATSTQVDTGCRTDLLTLDGAPIAVRITGSMDDAVAGDGLDVIPCGAPVNLDSGPHELRAAPGGATGFDIDRLVLTTPAWEQPSAPATAPEVVVTSSSSTRHTAVIRSTDGEPFWLVLDQSMNEGWDLSIDGADVDGPRPIDSYATGWLVDPHEAGELRATVTWPSQRAVDLAIVASVLGAIGCVGLIGWDTIRRRRAGERPAALPEAPAFDVDRRGLTPMALAPRRTWAYVIAAAVLAALVVHPFAAVPAALLVLLAVRLPLVGRAVPALLLGVAALQVLFFQVRDRHDLAGDWPRWFGGAHVCAMLGVITLAISAFAEASAPDQVESTEVDELVDA